MTHTYVLSSCKTKRQLAQSALFLNAPSMHSEHISQLVRTPKLTKQQCEQEHRKPGQQRSTKSTAASSSTKFTKSAHYHSPPQGQKRCDADRSASQNRAGERNGELLQMAHLETSPEATTTSSPQLLPLPWIAPDVSCQQQPQMGTTPPNTTSKQLS